MQDTRRQSKVVSFDMHRSGPSMSVHTNMTVGTVMELAKHADISVSTVVWILQQYLKICKIATKWLLHNVIEAYQWTHYEVTHQSITVTFGRDTILNETTAGDETWAFLQMHHPYSPPNAFFFIKICCPCIWWSLWHGTSKVVLLSCRSKRWIGMHGITCFFCSTTSLVQVRRSVQNCLKIMSS